VGPLKGDNIPIDKKDLLKSNECQVWECRLCTSAILDPKLIIEVISSKENDEELKTYSISLQGQHLVWKGLGQRAI
jgi:hypothetical protein